jgi:hypothetical protein
VGHILGQTTAKTDVLRIFDRKCKENSGEEKGRNKGCTASATLRYIKYP